MARRAATVGPPSPPPPRAEDEREQRIAAAQRRVEEIAQQATAQIREVRRELAFPLVHGTQLANGMEDGDDAR